MHKFIQKSLKSVLRPWHVNSCLFYLNPYFAVRGWNLSLHNHRKLQDYQTQLPWTCFIMDNLFIYKHWLFCQPYVDFTRERINGSVQIGQAQILQKSEDYNIKIIILLYTIEWFYHIYDYYRISLKIIFTHWIISTV